MAILSGRKREWVVLQPGRDTADDSQSQCPPEPQGLGAAGKTLHYLGCAALKVYVAARLDMDIRRSGPLPSGPKVLAANHPTTTDPFYILTLLRESISVLVTDSAFAVSGFGWYLGESGHIPCVRGSRGGTVDAVVRTVIAGRSVAIFPEGALSPLDGGFHRPHSGVARVTLRTGAPVVPIGIGVERERVRVRALNLPSGAEMSHLYTSGPYAVTVGEPLYYAGDHLDRARVRAVADDIMRHIRRLARESQRRVRSARTSSVLAQPRPARLVGVN